MKTTFPPPLNVTDAALQMQPAPINFTASAGDTFWVIGHRVTILHADAGFTYVDVVSPPRIPGPPPHRHRDCAEFFHVVEGTLEIFVGDERLIVGPGESVFVPRNTVHTFFNPGPSDARAITVFNPGGFEHFFRDMGVPVHELGARERSVEPSVIDRVIRESLRYEMELVLTRKP